jgi:hypothetical protein
LHFGKLKILVPATGYAITLLSLGAKTHIGRGAIDGKLIVGVTLAGYDATPDKIAKLVDVARMEEDLEI